MCVHLGFRNEVLLFMYTNSRLHPPVSTKRARPSVADVAEVGYEPPQALSGRSCSSLRAPPMIVAASSGFLSHLLPRTRPQSGGDKPPTTLTRSVLSRRIGADNDEQEAQLDKSGVLMGREINTPMRWHLELLFTIRMLRHGFGMELPHSHDAVGRPW